MGVFSLNRNIFSLMDDSSNARLEVNFYKWDEQIFNLATGAQEILNVIVTSKENGSTIGLRSKTLGEGIFITAIDDIILEDGETIILLKPFDVTGFMLPTNKVKLDAIDAACPLISQFRNPVLKSIEKDKTWFF